MEQTSQGWRIPARIIHVWGSVKASGAKPTAPSLPLSCRASLANARLLNPDYEMRLFDDAGMTAFVAAQCPEYLQVLTRFSSPIQRFDFFRYLAVYYLGGFYLDLDVYLAECLDGLRQHGCVFPFEELTLSPYLIGKGVDWELGNYAFGAEPGHPFVRAVIDNCIRSLDEPEWALQMYGHIPRPFRHQFVVTNTTGPGLVTRTLAEEQQLRSSVSVLFPENVLEPASWHRFGNYGVHLMTSSWRRDDGPIRRRLLRLWEARARGRFYRASSERGPRRHGEWLRV
jgi:mannosyltransferase OCH1-like enzyme